MTAVAFNPSLAVDLAHSRQLLPGVYIRDLRAASGTAVARGLRITVRLHAWLPDGTPLPTGASDTLVVRLGSGVMLPSWERGLEGMRVGGARQLILAPSQAYGAEGAGAVPPNTALVCQVEILGAS